MAIIPFTSISEDQVNVPNRDHFIKLTEPGDHYMRPQNVNTLKIKMVSPADLGMRASIVKKPSSNRDHVWNYLLENGYSDEQAAGIMGNLRQEHGFQTSGDGLAQWTGGRRAKLRSMKNPYSLSTQLNFLVNVELKGSYSYVDKAMRAATSVEEATRIFCNQYERPGIPVMNKRIAYAHEVYAIYHRDKSELKKVAVVTGSVGGVSDVSDKKKSAKGSVKSDEKKSADGDSGKSAK
jgi:hypothetical protein